MVRAVKLLITTIRVSGQLQQTYSGMCPGAFNYPASGTRVLQETDSGTCPEASNRTIRVPGFFKHIGSGRGHNAFKFSGSDTRVIATIRQWQVS